MYVHFFVLKLINFDYSIISVPSTISNKSSSRGSNASNRHTPDEELGFDAAVAALGE